MWPGSVAPLATRDSKLQGHILSPSGISETPKRVHGMVWWEENPLIKFKNMRGIRFSCASIFNDTRIPESKCASHKICCNKPGNLVLPGNRKRRVTGGDNLDENPLI